MSEMAGRRPETQASPVTVQCQQEPRINVNWHTMQPMQKLPASQLHLHSGSAGVTAARLTEAQQFPELRNSAKWQSKQQQQQQQQQQQKHQPVSSLCRQAEGWKQGAAGAICSGGSAGQAEGWIKGAAGTSVDSLASALLALRHSSSARGAASAPQVSATAASGARASTMVASSPAEAAGKGRPPVSNNAPRGAATCEKLPAACSSGIAPGCSRDDRYTKITEARIGAESEACQQKRAAHEAAAEPRQQHISEHPQQEVNKREECVQQQEAAEPVRGVFDGMRVMLDPDLDKAETNRCALRRSHIRRRSANEDHFSSTCPARLSGTDWTKTRGHDEF